MFKFSSFFVLSCLCCVSQLVDKYIKDARTLMASEDLNDVASALHLLDAALSISPRLETALELKARSLLFLRRFKEVADMLQDYIPSAVNDEERSEDSSSSSSSSRDGVKLLSDASSPGRDSSFKCFSVSDLKKKVMAGICKKCDKEGQWRYFLLFPPLTNYFNQTQSLLLKRWIFVF